MNFIALIMMISTQGLVIAATAFFLFKVLSIPSKRKTKDHQP
jgi:hypothetical protein